MLVNYNNHFFYNFKDTEDFDLIPDPYDFQTPYGVDQQWMCGEIELLDYIERYKQLSNQSNHIMRNMLNSKVYGNRFVL